MILKVDSSMEFFLEAKITGNLHHKSKAGKAIDKEMLVSGPEGVPAVAALGRLSFVA
jgi:hypothetical protein